MSPIGNCSDCGTGGVSLRYKPEVPVNEQPRPSICDRCRDFREEQATHYVPCEKCGDRVPSERAKSLDVTAEDEYYPEFIHFCPTCRPDANDDDADLMTDGGTELGVLCDVDDCEARIVGLDDGWQMSRGTVCQDCIDYHDRHGHWPDEDAEACVECRIDDGAINHDCDEFSGDGVILTPGDTCDYCGFEAAVTDGGEEANCALAALLEELSKGDRFTVDCHDSVLCVHSTGEFIGPVFLDVFDEDGGHWPVASVDGDLYLGYSQLEPADDQSRAKRIKDVEIIDQQETPSLVPDGGEEVGRATPQSLDVFCQPCDEFDATHTQTETGEWQCEGCGNVKTCGDPQWSDNCVGELVTPHEVKKGICAGCSEVIDSWRDDEDESDGDETEQATLVSDGGGTAVSSRDLYEFPMHNDSAVCTECGTEIEVPDVDDPNGDMKPPHWRREPRFDPFNDVFHALCDECYADEVSRIIDGVDSDV